MREYCLDQAYATADEDSCEIKKDFKESAAEVPLCLHLYRIGTRPHCHLLFELQRLYWYIKHGLQTTVYCMKCSMTALGCNFLADIYFFACGNSHALKRGRSSYGDYIQSRPSCVVAILGPLYGILAMRKLNFYAFTVRDANFLLFEGHVFCLRGSHRGSLKAYSFDPSLSPPSSFHSLLNLLLTHNILLNHRQPLRQNHSSPRLRPPSTLLQLHALPHRLLSPSPPLHLHPTRQSNRRIRKLLITNGSKLRPGDSNSSGNQGTCAPKIGGGCAGGLVSGSGCDELGFARRIAVCDLSVVSLINEIFCLVRFDWCLWRVAQTEINFRHRLLDAVDQITGNIGAFHIVELRKALRFDLQGETDIKLLRETIRGDEGIFKVAVHSANAEPNFHIAVRVGDCVQQLFDWLACRLIQVQAFSFSIGGNQCRDNDNRHEIVMGSLFHRQRRKPALEAHHSTVSRFGDAPRYIHSRREMRDSSIE
ncbi:hypothetical protein KC354_g168 [Hortaea werneckii]|nr:hypothetical protein KC354_g168 [Hortaea werneckii]